MPTLKSLLADERHAIDQYGQAGPAFRKQGNKRAARLMSHIRGEEVEHKEELQREMKRGSVSNIGRK